MQKLHIDTPFELENGAVLPELTLAYHTYGRLNARRDNVVWVCHALTASSDAADWWSGLVGEGKLLDSAKYFIVCANMLGSDYGSSSPRDIDRRTGQVFGLNFPLVTVRDMVMANIKLRQHLGIQQIELLLGGSMGGQQAMEWAIVEPSRVRNLGLLACGARQPAWAIALNESQRLALVADPTFVEVDADAGAAGLVAARAMAMISYRSFESYNATQTDNDGRTDGFSAASYQRYQGLKLQRRFHAHCYWSLGRSMDSHDVGRNRGGVVAALGSITAKTAVIAISSDGLFPVSEQRQLARLIPDARLYVIDSHYGHDGFLLEFEQISAILKRLLTVPHSMPLVAELT